jgi:protein MAK16
MLKRMRKLRLQELPEIVTIKKKAERREKIRESKAAIAAKHETEIEKELLERLQAGTYGDIYNFNQKAFRKVAEGMEAQEDEDDVSLDEEAEIQALVGSILQSSTRRSLTKITM